MEKTIIATVGAASILIISILLKRHKLVDVPVQRDGVVVGRVYDAPSPYNAIGIFIRRDGRAKEVIRHSNLQGAVPHVWDVLALGYYRAIYAHNWRVGFRAVKTLACPKLNQLIIARTATDEYIPFGVLPSMQS